MALDKQTVINFTNDFNKLVCALEMKYGMAIRLDRDSVRYTSNTITGTVKAIVSDNLGLAGEPIDDYEKLEFERMARKYNFEPTDYKCTVKVLSGQKALLVGFKPKARKNKFIVLIGDTKYVTSCVEKIN